MIDDVGSMIYKVGSSLVSDMPVDFRDMIPNDFKIIEPNDNLQVIISQYIKSGKNLRQILAILNMIGISYNIALNNLMFYVLYGSMGKTVMDYFNDYYNGSLLSPTPSVKWYPRY